MRITGTTIYGLGAYVIGATGGAIAGWPYAIGAYGVAMVFAGIYLLRARRG